jgi:hypothetical protein
MTAHTVSVDLMTLLANTIKAALHQLHWDVVEHPPRMGFEVFSMVKIHIVVFQVMTPCSLLVRYQQIASICRVNIYPGDEGNIFLRNPDPHIPDYMVS